MAPPIVPPNPIVETVAVRGTQPTGLVGQLICVGPDFGARNGIVHSVELSAGQVRCRNRTIETIVFRNIVAFGGSVLALGDDTLAYELASDLATIRPVDLAGQRRTLTAFPSHDPLNGDLHMVATTSTAAQEHVVVSAGALTRRSRPLAGNANRVTDLAITASRVVFATDGYIGITYRDSDALATWIVTGAAAPRLVHAHDQGDTVVVLAMTPALERWTLHPPSGTIRRHVIEPKPQRFVCLSQELGGVPRYIWTIGGGAIDQHDFATSRCTRRTFLPGTPGGFAFVADPVGADDADGGWLVGLVHRGRRSTTELVVLDGMDTGRPAVAAIRLPRNIPHGLHATWIPAPSDYGHEGGRS